MDVEDSVAQSIESGEYLEILAFEFDYNKHTEIFSPKTGRKKRFNNKLPKQERIINQDIENILLKKYQILRHTNSSKEECSKIINLIIEHRIRFIIYTILKTLKLGSNYIDAEEYFSLAIIKIYSIIHKYNPWYGLYLGTYLYTCISRDLISKLRNNKLSTNEEEILNSLQHEEEPLEHHIEDRELCHKIINSAGLTRKQRFIIDKVFFQDIREIDLAAKMGVSRQAINNRSSNALIKMQQYVKSNNIIWEP